MSQHYVVINSDGTYGLYIEGVSATFPSTALEISDADYNTFINNEQDYDFENINGVATLVALTTVYIASDFGLTITESKNNVTVPSDSVSFSSSPTVAQLKAAFPATSGSKPFTVNSIGAVNDTIAIGGVNISCSSLAVAGTAYVVGADIAGTAANIAACLNSNVIFAAVYNAAVTGATITITEIKKGNGDTPANAIYTGSISITSGTAITSTKGYSTAIMNENLTALASTYTKEMEQIIRAYNLALIAGTSTTNHTAELANLKTWLTTNQEAIINEQ